MCFGTSERPKYVRIMQPRALATEFSAAFWFKAQSNDAGGCIISKQRHGGTGWHVALNQNTIWFAGMGRPKQFWGTERVSFSVAEWHHVVVTFSRSASTAMFYMDGQLLESVNMENSQVLTDERQAITIGREWDESEGSGWTGVQKNLDGGRKLRGGVLLRQIALWEVPITASDVMSIYGGKVEPENLHSDSVVTVIAGADGQGNVVEVSQKPAVITSRTKEDDRGVSQEIRLDAEDERPEKM
eukprot:TRINITY_DN37644_c0_g1_i1.p1 TRINITY_DN37644_c0_g1~~TRINITY_DN37644_c0_g1_i1.p1  ORF type:complete len:257 (-),score=38.73 TRINITY_DN37644_c0_g1_i1:6-734(-)